MKKEDTIQITLLICCLTLFIIFFTAVAIIWMVGIFSLI